MSQFNIRVPPDSTGKRIGTTILFSLTYRLGTIPFVIGEPVSTPSGLLGTILQVNGSTTEGYIEIALKHDSTEATVHDENIVASGATKAVCNGTGLPFYNQNVVLRGANNPLNGVRVDSNGAMFIRGPEGSDQYDAYGRHQVSTATSLIDYVLARDDLPSKFTTSLFGAGTSTYSGQSSCVILSTTTAAGDKVQRISNLYHKNQTGLSQLSETNILIGDTGKPNVRRRWGYADSADGVYFELDGTTLNAVFRSSASGAPLEIRVPQSAWAYDRLDGTRGDFNPSGIIIDVSKINSYWFDMQCSAGNARVGVNIDGIRIVCHKFAIGNNYSTEHSVIGTLPLFWEQENTGIAASTSEMRVFCSNVKSEGEFTPSERIFSGDTGDTLKLVDSNTVYSSIMSFRSIQTFKSKPNRVWVLPSRVDVFSDTSPIVVEIVKNATITGGTWGPMDPDSSLEGNLSGSIGSDGSVLHRWMIKDLFSCDLTKIFNNDSEIVSRKAIITDAPNTYSIRAKLVKTGAATNVRFVANWKEYQ